jgi:hypothetical protein
VNTKGKADPAGLVDIYMLEHLYPEQELKALGQHILLQAIIETSRPLPTPADRIVGVLVALLAQGIECELDLLHLSIETTGAAGRYVERLIRLFDGRDPQRHLWVNDGAGNLHLLSTVYQGSPEWRPECNTKLAQGRVDPALFN